MKKSNSKHLLTLCVEAFQLCKICNICIVVGFDCLLLAYCTLIVFLHRNFFNIIINFLVVFVSIRPASWKDESGAIITKRSKEQAIETLKGFRQQIQDGKISFADLAKVYWEIFEMDSKVDTE